MPDRTEFDLDSRPETYWDGDASLFANIKGEMRRRMITSAISEGKVHELRPCIFVDTLPEDIRNRLGSIHSSLLGGEFLPDYTAGEVEIVRVSLASSQLDTISLRAQHDSGLIRYRWVDEYESSFELPRTSSREPLTLEELIEFIDNTKQASRPFNPSGIVVQFWWELVHDGYSPETGVSFTAISSPFYTELSRWYEESGEEWSSYVNAKLMELVLARGEV